MAKIRTSRFLFLDPRCTISLSVVFFLGENTNSVQYVIIQKLCPAMDRPELNVELISTEDRWDLRDC